MARRNANTAPVDESPVVEEKKSKREYDLNYFVDGLNDTKSSNTRRVYCGAQAIVRLFKDTHEQGEPAEDADWLAKTIRSIAALATPAALAADAKAGKGVSEAAKRQNAAAAIASRDAVIADLMRRLAAAEAPPAAPATPKKGRKAAV
jgi:hypothetical protein